MSFSLPLLFPRTVCRWFPDLSRYVRIHSKDEMIRDEELHPPDWTSEAACLNRPYEWFTPDDDPDDWEVAKNLLRKGQKLCRQCPVSEPCLSTASDDDLLYTVRGGLLPAYYSDSVRGRPIGKIEDRPEPVSYPEGYCRRGHDTAKTGKTVDNDCYVCHWRAKDRKSLSDRLRRRGKDPRTVLEPIQPMRWEYASVCPKGHELRPVEARPGALCEVCSPEEFRRALRLRAKAEAA